MRDTIIEAALTSARDTDTVVIGRGAVARTGKAIRDAMDTSTDCEMRPAMIVADDCTWHVAGNKVTAALAEARIPAVSYTHLTLPTILLV